MYRLPLGLATIAFLLTRRGAWWLVLGLVLAATAPRLGLLVYAELLVT